MRDDRVNGSDDVNSLIKIKVTNKREIPYIIFQKMRATERLAWASLCAYFIFILMIATIAATIKPVKTPITIVVSILEIIIALLCLRRVNKLLRFLKRYRNGSITLNGSSIKK